MSVRIITAEFGSTLDLSNGVFHTLVSANMCQSSPGQLSMLYRPWVGEDVGLGIKLGVVLAFGRRRSSPLHRRSAR